MIADEGAERRRSIALWLILATLTLVLVVLGGHFLEPSPPKKIVLAAGQVDGGYYTFGREYQKRLERLGLSVEVVATNGSVENLHRLVDGRADVAFVQGGTAPLVQDPGETLRGLASLYAEPLWVFYRGRLASESLSALRGRRISMGPRESGTEAVTRVLLAEHGFDLSSPLLVNLTTKEASRQLVDGELGAAFVVTSDRDPAIMELLRQPDVGLLSVPRAVVYTRKFRYLTTIRLNQGLLDLKDDIPREDKTLLAPTAMLVARTDTHPRVVEQILKVGRAIHSPGGLLDTPLRFPSLEGIDLPVHETAQTYLTSGESFLSGLLPYWALRRASQLRPLILPLLAVWLPFLRVLPAISMWRAGRWMKHFHASLNRVEGVLTRAESRDELKVGLQTLDKLRSDMDATLRSLSGQRLRDASYLRLHLSLLHHQTLERLLRTQRDSGDSGR
ncbi:MAG TPA: TAXI family TRAP transporter solute-binding subunit [Candidatus Methylomirabilis sp.]|nr:TAXI family TRAP transporter solute-binding subunit [Candidatus Methylomirabilis sp.]